MRLMLFDDVDGVNVLYKGCKASGDAWSVKWRGLETSI